MHNINSLVELKNGVISRLTPKYLNDESLSIIDELRKINNNGLITFESQPSETVMLSRNIKWKKRAYLNGIYPKNLVQSLAEILVESDRNYIIGETVLNHDGKDTLQLYNYDKDDDLVKKSHVYREFGLYPMALSINLDDPLENRYVEGYSGNIRRPFGRYEYFEDFNDILLNQIIDKMNLIQIWNRDIDYNIFPDIVDATQELLPYYKP